MASHISILDKSNAGIEDTKIEKTVPHMETEKLSRDSGQEEAVNSSLDFSDVKGQDDLIEAIVLGAAGGHNILMIGEPGCGKTMIAQRIPTILPRLRSFITQRNDRFLREKAETIYEASSKHEIDVIVREDERFPKRFLDIYSGMIDCMKRLSGMGVLFQSILRELNRENIVSLNAIV